VQQPASATQSEPRATTARFGDWALRCSSDGSGAQKRRVCAVVQTLMPREQKGPVAQLAFGSLAAAAPVQLTVVLPVNVALYPCRAHHFRRFSEIRRAPPAHALAVRLCDFRPSCCPR